MNYYWVALLFVTLATLAFRLLFLAGQSPPAFPKTIKRALDYVPPAVLSAIVLPEFINLSSPNLAVLAAGAAAAAAVLVFKRDFLAIVVGFLAYAIAI
jgi:branched-subunit amino acid transport protein